MRVLFAGTPEVALPTLEALIASAHDVVGVLTRADARRGRGRTLHPSPVAAVARQAGLDVRTPATLRGEEGQEVGDWMRSLKADVAVVVAYGRLVHDRHQRGPPGAVGAGRSPSGARRPALGRGGERAS